MPEIIYILYAYIYFRYVLNYTHYINTYYVPDMQKLCTLYAHNISDMYEIIYIICAYI